MLTGRFTLVQNGRGATGLLCMENRRKERREMAVSKKQQVLMGLLWVVIFPLVSYISYSSFLINKINWTNLILLFALLLIMMLLPIKFRNVSVSFERWITFTIFFQYGLFVEFVFIQAAMFFLLFAEKSSLPINHKFFVNSIIFSITSFVSAYIFYASGGTIDALKFKETIMYALLYAVIYTIVNNLLLKIYFALNKRTYSLYSKEATWDYMLTLIMIPFSISHYFLDNHFGNQSLLLIGIPILIVLLTIRMYTNSNSLYDQLSSAAEIGHELADQLLFDEVIQTFLEKLKDVVPYHQAYIVDFRSERSLFPLMGYEHGKITKHVKEIVFLEEKTEDDGLNMEHIRIYTNKKEMQGLQTIQFSDEVETVLTAPIIRNKITEGFLIITSKNRNACSTSFIDMIEILTGYFAVSLEKARYFENKLRKSERCGLTKLHNYRYLDRKLDENVVSFHLQKMEELSLIILDIDYFKKINDQYGHESGNQILLKLANLLRTYQSEQDIIARYGGEEFVFILPNCSKREALKIAEKMRKEVAQTAFEIRPDLSSNTEVIKINITISLGVASIPNDALSAREIMRKADRALYIYAKQAGRNKVGVLENQRNYERTKTQTLPIV